MSGMTRQDLHGFVPAVVTPFDGDGVIDEKAFGSLAEWLVSLGATAVCVAGDNGESWALSPAEYGRLTNLAVAAVDVPVIAGCSAPTLNGSLDRARAAAENGAAALLMMPPTYVLKGSRAEIVGRYEKVAAAVPLPIIAYNSPRRVGYSLSLDDLAAVIDAAPVIGIKESHRDFFHHTHLLERFSDVLSIMTGPSHFVLPSLALGAKGCIATGPELIGTAAGRLAGVASAGPTPEYAEVHFRLTAIYELLMSVGTWPSALKAALNLLGQPAGLPRDPVMPLAGVDLDKLRAGMVAAGLSPK